MAANIGWAPDTPSGSSAIRLGDEDIRSFKTSIQQALDSEHSFPSNFGAEERGRHTPNASRVSYGNVASVPLIAPSDMSGVMYQETTGGKRLWNFPFGASTQSNVVGGVRHIQMDTNPTADFGHILSGFTIPPNASTAMPVTFAAAPIVTISIQTTESTHSFIGTVTELTTTNITVSTVPVVAGGPTSDVEVVHVLALGEVAL